MPPTKPYALLIQQWRDRFTHAEREIPTPLSETARLIIKAALAQYKAADGDPSTWVDCDHCGGEGEGAFYAHDPNKVGICYRCLGKGKTSEADRRRNWGHSHAMSAERASA